MSSEGFSASALIFYFLLQTAVNLRALSLSTDSAGGKWTAAHTNPSPSERKNAAIILITPPLPFTPSLRHRASSMTCQHRQGFIWCLFSSLLFACRTQASENIMTGCSRMERELLLSLSLKAASIGLRSSASHGIFFLSPCIFFNYTEEKWSLRDVTLPKLAPPSFPLGFPCRSSDTWHSLPALCQCDAAVLPPGDVAQTSALWCSAYSPPIRVQELLFKQKQTANEWIFKSGSTLLGCFVWWQGFSLCQRDLKHSLLRKCKIRQN